MNDPRSVGARMIAQMIAKHRLLLTLAASLLLASHIAAEPASAAPTEAAALMRDVERNASPPDERVRIEMALVDSSGQVRRRTAMYYRRQREPGSLEDMKLIRFDSPPEMDGSAVLTLENAESADDQWLYLPAYRTSRRIPSSNRSDRYMGTDFSYEDVSDDKIPQFQYSFVGEEEIGGRTYRIVEQIPIADEVKNESAYGRKRQWVDPERLIATRIDYFGKDGTLIKRFEASSPVQIADYWRWEQVTMTDFRIDHRTEIVYRDRAIDTGSVDTSLFTVRYLERGR